MKRISIIKLILFLLLATGIFSCTKIPLIADLFYWHTTVFFNNDCNYSKIRISETRLDPDEISSSIPEGSTVYFNFKKNKEAFVDMRYLLYPVKVKSYDSTSNISQPGSYLIDFTDSLYKSFPFLLLKTGQHLIDAGHSGFSTNKTLQAIPPLYARILSFLLLSLFYVLIGALFLKLLKFKATGLLHLLTCAYMSGFLINTIILGIEIISGCLFTQFLVVITCCSTLLILIAANRFNLKNIFVFEQTPKVENAGNSRLYKVHLTSVLLLLFFIVAINLVRPVIDMGDATSFWMLKSKIIFHEQSFIFSDVHKNEYPILLPLSVAANYALMN